MYASPTDSQRPHHGDHLRITIRVNSTFELDSYELLIYSCEPKANGCSNKPCSCVTRERGLHRRTFIEGLAAITRSSSFAPALQSLLLLEIASRRLSVTIDWTPQCITKPSCILSNRRSHPIMNRHRNHPERSSQPDAYSMQGYGAAVG